MTHYLVKWCSLSYEEATWELQEDLDPEKIREFEEVQKLPADLRHVVSRNVKIVVVVLKNMVLFCHQNKTCLKNKQLNLSTTSGFFFVFEPNHFNWVLYACVAF